MGLFRRRPPSSAAPEGIGEFWQWWPGVRADFARDGEETDTERATEMAERVARIHPDLAWEISAPGDGGHVLTLTGGGRDDLRALTERWMRAAPEDDAWEFRPALAADRDALDSVFRLEDTELELSHIALGVRVDAEHSRVNVAVYHPDFLFLPDDARAATARRALALALGEDEVSRWIGTITPAEERPVDALGLSALPAVTRQLADTRGGDWLSGRTRTPRGRPSLVKVRFPLRRVDHPLCDTHILLSVPYAHANPDRLPVDPSASALRTFEEKLESIGPDALLAAHETGDDHRVFHIYADSESGALSEIDQLAAAWQEGRVRVVTRPDPQWQALAPYLM
ncbi:MAG TPA: DUF695 domain-containing protein [Streptosporangiaceae bacterium]